MIGLQSVHWRLDDSPGPVQPQLMMKRSKLRQLTVTGNRGDSLNPQGIAHGAGVRSMRKVKQPAVVLLTCR